jgi:pimeloyl-ACP methyl ester carboxylesterase
MSVPIVLVHGGGHGAWCWEPTVAELTTAVLAVDLPPVSIRGGAGRLVEVPECSTLTLDDWAATVLEDASAAGWDWFVLAGHSLAGATIGEVARRAPDRVAHLVYVSAVVPAEGGSIVDSLPPELLERAADGLTEEAVRELFCTDMAEDQTRFVLANVGTEVVGVLSEAVSRRGTPRTMPVTFVRLARDNADVVDVVDVDAGHDVMISAPAVLAGVLDEVASSAIS